MGLINKSIIIKMKCIQSTEEEKNEIELITEGTLEKEDDRISLTYIDSETTGFEGSVTVIETFGSSMATISRTGKSNSSFVIEAGKKHHCHYGTPYGDMMMGIYTHSIENQLNENGGHLYMKYTVDINSSYISDNEIVLDVSEK